MPNRMFCPNYLANLRGNDERKTRVIERAVTSEHCLAELSGEKLAAIVFPGEVAML